MNATSTVPRHRPLWRWILLALSPSLAYLGFASLSFAVPALAPVSVIVGAVVIPLVGLVVLVNLADKFCESRDDPSGLGRLLFVVGFGCVNAVIWFGGCGITAFNMDAPAKPQRQQKLEHEGDQTSDAASSAPRSPGP